MRIEVRGMPRLVARIAAVQQGGPQAVLGELVRTGETILTAAKRDYVPVDTGALRASGVVLHHATPQGAEVTIGFGGPAAPYAVIVHEDLTARHPVGQAKYLEIPFVAHVAGMAERMALAIQHVAQQGLQVLTRYRRGQARSAQRTARRRFGQLAE